MHEAFTTCHINPEEPCRGLDVDKCYSLWKECLKSYRLVNAKFNASGQHNGRDFWLFCETNTDVFYLYLTLKKVGNTELESIHYRQS